jgi:hypothetical protein
MFSEMRHGVLRVEARVVLGELPVAVARVQEEVERVRRL